MKTRPHISTGQYRTAAQREWKRSSPQGFHHPRKHHSEKVKPDKKSRALSFTNLLVVVDFSSASQKALAAARQIAARTGACISLLAVTKPISTQADFGYGPVTRHTPDLKLVHCIRRRLDRMARQFSESGISVTPNITCGCSETEIIKAARELDCNLIILGIADPQLIHWPAGSIADYVIGKADCPVMVLHPEHQPVRHPYAATIPATESAGAL